MGDDLGIVPTAQAEKPTCPDGTTSANRADPLASETRNNQSSWRHPLIGESGELSPQLSPSASGSTTAAAPSAPARDAHGRFQPGNLEALKHALRTDQVPPEFATLSAEVEAFVAGCLVDDGDDVSTRRRSLLNYRARLHRRILQLDGALELRGLIDKRGRLRVSWLQQLQGLMGQAKAIDAQLGLDRRAKRVETIGEYAIQRRRESAAVADADAASSNAIPEGAETRV
jgi:hypothetical protein